MIHIRRYQDENADELWELFYNTVHFIAIQDYSKSQVDAWASKKIDRSSWRAMLAKNDPFLAIDNGKILGYADLQNDGLIDHFYCHHKFQGKGVGSILMQRILDEAEEKGIPRLYSYVSKTAKSFFESFGFLVVDKQEVVVRGETFINYLMEKVD